MTTNEDIRWKQRLNTYIRSLTNLSEALKETASREPSKLERQGIVKLFELCYELAWKTLQDYLRAVGYEDDAGPKPVLRRAFELGLVPDGELWAEIHRARNEGAHVYNEDTARRVAKAVRSSYFTALQELARTLEAKPE